MEILVGDIGGTNADFALIDLNGFEIIRHKSYKTGNKVIENIEEFLDLLENENSLPKRACIAVAGLVEEGAVEMPNADLEISNSKIKEETDLEEVILINDLEATAYGINILKDDGFKNLQKGEAIEDESVAVVAAGTGLGKSILVMDKEGEFLRPLRSEGGHEDFPVKNDLELELVGHIRENSDTDLVTFGELVSGRGLENIYSFLQQKKYPEFESELTAREISETRNDNDCSRESFDMFVKFYGRCCKDFVLDTYARGGLYISGGIAAKNSDEFDEIFLNEFHDVEDELKEVINSIPVKLITDDRINLKGAGFGFKQLNKE